MPTKPPAPTLPPWLTTTKLQDLSHKLTQQQAAHIELLHTLTLINPESETVEDAKKRLTKLKSGIEKRIAKNKADIVETVLMIQIEGQALDALTNGWVVAAGKTEEPSEGEEEAM